MQAVPEFLAARKMFDAFRQEDNSPESITLDELSSFLNLCNALGCRDFAAGYLTARRPDLTAAIAYKIEEIKESYR